MLSETVIFLTQSILLLTVQRKVNFVAGRSLLKPKPLSGLQLPEPIYKEQSFSLFLHCSSYMLQCAAT